MPSGVAFALPVERLVGAVLLEQDHRQQAGPDPPARDDVERRRRLGDGLAVAAGGLLAHGLPHEPAARHDVERLGDHLADLREPLAIAAAAARRRRDDDSLPRPMSGSFGRRRVLGRGLPELGQLQLELVDQPLAPLAGSPELLALGFGQQQLQPLDLERRGGDQCLGLAPSTALGQDHRMRRGKIGRKGHGLVPHALDASTTSAILEVERQMNKKYSAGQLRSPGSLRHPPINSFEEIAELTRRDRHHTIRRRRPDEAAVLQPLGKQTDTLTITPENLDQIATFAAEDENLTAIGVALQDLLNLQRQTVHPAPHVGGADGEPHPGARRERDHRRGRAFITAGIAVVTAAGSAAPSILTRAPPESTISIRPGAEIGSIAGSADTGPVAGSGITATGTSAGAAGVGPASSCRHLNG